MDAILDAMVRMAVVVEHLARAATVGRREGLVPLREEERLRVRRRVLQRSGVVNIGCNGDEGGIWGDAQQ